MRAAAPSATRWDNTGMDAPPRIEFVHTSDGARIAYWKIGRGPAIVQLPALPYSHIEAEWQIPELRRSYELLALRRTLVRYDGRGTGLSDRHLSASTTEVLASDLDAVVGTVSSDPVALLAVINSAPAAVRFAVSNPDRTSHLLMWCPRAQGHLQLNDARLDALRNLMRSDWELYTETFAHAFIGWGQSKASRQFAEFMRASVTQEKAIAFHEAVHAFDVLELLPEIRCPTLVMARESFPFSLPGVFQDIANRIPNARLAVFEGDSAVPYLDDWRAIARTVYGFLGETDESIRETMGSRRVLTLLRGGRHALSEREQEVIDLVVRGYTNRQIGEALFISEKTVENHIGRILAKLDLTSRTRLAAYAVEHGLTKSA